MNKLAGLVCDLKPLLEQVFTGMYSNRIFGEYTTTGHTPRFMAHDNEWYPIPHMWGSNYARCSGMHGKEAHYGFGDNYMSFNMKLDTKDWLIPQYCDSESVIRETDPRRIYFNNDTQHENLNYMVEHVFDTRPNQDNIKDKYKRFNDGITQYIKNDFEYFKQKKHYWDNVNNVVRGDYKY